MTTNRKPWLLLDVDGVLSVSVGWWHVRRAGLVVVEDRFGEGGDRTMTLNPQHIPLLQHATQTFAIAWATMRSNPHRTLNPWTGINADTVPIDPANHSKVPDILTFTRNTPFVWIDDNVTPTEHDMLNTSGVPHLVITPDHEVGLIPEHLTEAHQWATRLP